MKNAKVGEGKIKAYIDGFCLRICNRRGDRPMKFCRDKKFVI